LSGSALAALQEFYKERDERQKQFEDLKAVSEENATGNSKVPLSMDVFAEDWNESQFWVCDLTPPLYDKIGEIVRGHVELMNGK